MRHIAELEDGKVPQDDEFKFRDRAKDLVRRWHLVAYPTANDASDGALIGEVG